MWQAPGRIPLGHIAMVIQSYCLQIEQCKCPKESRWTMVPVLRGAIEYKYEGLEGEMVRAFVCRTCHQVTWADNAVWEGEEPTHIRPRNDHGDSYVCRYLSAPATACVTPSATSDVKPEDDEPDDHQSLDQNLDKTNHAGGHSAKHASNNNALEATWSVQKQDWGLQDSVKSQKIRQYMQDFHLTKIHGKDAKK